MEIARWFAVSSLQVTGKAQHRKSAQQADALHLILVRSGGKEALRNLRNSHGFEQEEVRALARKFPERFWRGRGFLCARGRHFKPGFTSALARLKGIFCGRS